MGAFRGITWVLKKKFFVVVFFKEIKKYRNGASMVKMRVVLNAGEQHEENNRLNNLFCL